MGVTRKSAAVAAAVPAQEGHIHGDDGHDHGPDHAHGPDHKHGHKGSDDHDHGLDHGGIFGERTELIFALLCGLVLGIGRSEEPTSDLQSLMRLSYAVFCSKKQKNTSLTPTV